MFPGKVLPGIVRRLFAVAARERGFQGAWGRGLAAAEPFRLSRRDEAKLKRLLRFKARVSETLNFVFYRVPALVYVGRVCREFFITR